MKGDVRVATVIAALAVSMALSGCSGQGPDGSGPGGAGTVSPHGGDGVDLRAKALREEADTLGIALPPQVAIVRETSPFDHVQAQVDCLRAGGYDATAEQGGVHVRANAADPTDAYWQQFNLASYVCDAQYPLAEIYYEPLTSEQKQAYADYYLDELPKCLKGFGAQFETPPSREVFLARFDTDGPWTPYATVEIPPGKTDAAEAACPEGIPPDQLWKKPS